MRFSHFLPVKCIFKSVIAVVLHTNIFTAVTLQKVDDKIKIMTTREQNAQFTHIQNGKIQLPHDLKYVSRSPKLTHTPLQSALKTIILQSLKGQIEMNSFWEEMGH